MGRAPGQRPPKVGGGGDKGNPLGNRIASLGKSQGERGAENFSPPFFGAPRPHGWVRPFVCSAPREGGVYKNGQRPPGGARTLGRRENQVFFINPGQRESSKRTGGAPWRRKVAGALLGISRKEGGQSILGAQKGERISPAKVPPKGAPRGKNLGPKGDTWGGRCLLAPFGEGGTR